MWQKRINVAVIILTILLLLSVILPMILASRAAARKTQSRNNLKLIGLALHNYESTYQGLPPGGVFNFEGRGYHGWMTSILPFVISSPLFNSIDFNEPWDYAKNAGSFLTENTYYQNPDEPLSHRHWEFPLAHYSANSHVMAVNSFTKVKSIENSAFVVGELDGDFLPWGCPYNWRELGDLNSNPPTYGRSTRDGCQFLFVDGRVEFVVNGTSHDILEKLSGEDLTGFKANTLKIQRPSEFPCSADALRISWGRANEGGMVEVRYDIHGNLKSRRAEK